MLRRARPAMKRSTTEKKKIPQITPATARALATPSFEGELCAPLQCLESSQSAFKQIGRVAVAYGSVGAANLGTGGAATRNTIIARNAIGGPSRNHRPRHRKVKRHWAKIRNQTIAGAYLNVCQSAATGTSKAIAEMTGERTISRKNNVLTTFTASSEEGTAQRFARYNSAADFFVDQYLTAHAEHHGTSLFEET